MRSRMAAIDSLNRHYQPFSIDSVSEMADYFDSHGTPHDRIMAYYLLGSAFRDAGEAPAALKVEDSADADQPTYYGAFHFNDGADSDLEYAYDQNGNMTKDLNKDITEIKYNLMNLPAKITYSDGKSLSFTYSANGERLSVTHNMVYTGDFNAYFGHFIYRNGSLNRVLVDGGYTSGSQYHFYLTDHFVNNRVVVNASGTVEQVNHYYPYGGLTGESTGGSVQPYKYNGKELERMNGLDLYDYGARWMDGALGRFTTMDPLCEKYYDVSPYAYCAGNPINKIDPDGRDEWEINSQGQVVKRIETSKHDAFFIVDDDNKRIEGKSISFRHGTVFRSFKSHTKIKEKVIENGEKKEKEVIKNYDVYEMRGDNNSTKLFEFMAENTSVEWGHMKLGIEGDKGYNVLTTSHEERNEYGAADMLNKQYLGGYTIREHTHSHPLNTPRPSEYNPKTKTGDLGFALDLHKFRPKVIFKLYLPGSQ